jgi:hypothetical protein
MAVCDIEGAIKYIENLYAAVPSTPEEKFTKEILGNLVQGVNATRAAVRDAASFVANAGPIDIGTDLTPYLSKPEEVEPTSSTGTIVGMVLGETKAMDVSEFLDLVTEISAGVDIFRGLNTSDSANEALSTYTQVIKEFVAAKGGKTINVKLVTQVIHGKNNTEHLGIFRKKSNTLEIAMHPSGDIDVSSLLLPTAKVALSGVVHALTQQGLEGNPKLDGVVTALRMKVMKLQEKKSGATSTDKGLSSNQSFITETLTSFRFQKLLVSLSPTVKSTVVSRVEGIFKKLVTFVKQKSGISTDQPTLLEEALSLVSATLGEEWDTSDPDIPLEAYSVVEDPGAPIKSVVLDRTADYSTLTKLVREAKDSPITNFTNKLINMVTGAESSIAAGTDLKVVNARMQGEVTDGAKYHKFDYDKNEGVIVTDESFEYVLPSFIDDYKQDPTTTKYIHFDNHTHESTRSKTASIRGQLFGDKALTKEFIPGEPLVLNSPYLEDAAVEQGMLDNGEEFTVVSSRISTEHVSYKVGQTVVRSGAPIELNIVTATSTTTGDTHIFRKPVGGVSNKRTILNTEKSFHTSKPEKAYQLMDALAFGLGHGYVINTHKSQGSTYDNVYMDLGNVVRQYHSNSNEITKYTYITASRSRKKLVVIDSREGAVINPGPLRSPEHVAPAFKGVDKAESSDIIDKRNKCDGKG